MIIIGLGNPGRKYVKTRHNIGQDIVLEYAKKNDFSSWYTPSHGEYMESHGEINGEESTLVIPLTFMNLSGRAAAHFIKSEKDMMKLVVIHDDLDLPIGQIKESINRGDGGHNGVKNMIKILGGKNFKRIRVGISPADKDGNIDKILYKGLVEKYVLEPFKDGEWDKLVIEGIKRI